MSQPCRIRLAHPADANFLRDSWKNSYVKYFLAYGGVTAIDGRTIFSAQQLLIERLLKQRTVLVACPLDDPSIAMGYVVGFDGPSSTLVDWVYVKHDLRRLGVGKMLLSELGVKADKPLLYTHDSLKLKHLIKHHKALVSYVPAGSTLE